MVNTTVARLALLAVNAVPVVGWFAEDWAAGTTLAVYWFENVAACLFVAARAIGHARLSPRRGHFDYQPPAGDRRSADSSFVKGFLVASLVFSAAHAIFLAVILLLLNHQGERGIADVDWGSVGRGCAIVLAILIIEFVVDLLSLRNWTFLQLEQTANRGLGRVAVVHLTLIFGLLAVAISGASDALFGVFVVLKTLYSLSWALPQWEPATPPRWLNRMMARLPKVRTGERFSDAWVKDRAEEADRRVRNEQPWVGRRRAA